MEIDLDIPDSASQWYKLRRNPRLFFWWQFHRATTSLRTLPNFLVIGVMKGGTTSLFNYLSRHPQVNPPFRKEIKFFDIHYPKGLGWYRAHFPLQAKMKAGAVTGEATPYYLFHPLAAQRAAKILPEAKLIVLLRNPVDRAYSHYNHMVRVKRETLSFEEAIEREPERLDGEVEKIIADPNYSTFTHVHYSYLARGRYAEQIQTLLQLFPKENILILQSEDLYAEPVKVMEMAFSFLSLPFKMGKYEVFKQGTYKGDMEPATRQKLIDYFRPYNQQLYTLLSMKFDWDK
jgi:hypothetical protein